MLDEFYWIAFRKKIYHTLDELKADLDLWLVEYNYRRPHQGRWCFGKTPMQTFLDALPLAKEKLMDSSRWRSWGFRRGEPRRRALIAFSVSLGEGPRG